MEAFIPSHDLHDNFIVRERIDGLAMDDGEGSRVYGFDRVGRMAVPSDGGCFGYVAEGEVRTTFGSAEISIHAGMWFSTFNGFLAHTSGARVVVFQRVGHSGTFALGVLPSAGDLKYIDGCRDSVLVAPRILGMPCLNALYAPPGVHQTMHTHPSTRAGFIVDATEATCETTTERHVLAPGSVFFLPRNGRHKFLTGPNGKIKLVAYHPDSDFGPTDELHPMLNRTMVDGVSASLLPGIQTR